MEDTFDILNFTANLDISALCCDEEYNGFDKQNGNNWIYPTNYPVRDYQYNIIKAGLFKNTLVSLPTGLGKTFIAAVIMYNFYRWYPMGKIIFVAPTRPLVAQQIDACYNIMAIPQDDTIEMTGTMSITNRKTAWLKKRVIFATPQVVHNDLESGNCPSELVRCLVIDEAHKAKGRYSFCQIVELLTLKNHNLFRVIALSATPGSKVDDVIQVVKNLKISHLELRSEECIDVANYSFSRKIQTVVISLGEELSYIRNQFLEIIDKYTRRLVQFKVLTSNIGTLSKGRIIMLFKEYQTRERSQRHPQHGRIMLDFTMVITLYHALELLTRHGSRVFLNFFDDHPDKTWVGKDDHLVAFLERLRDDLGVDPMSLDLSSFPDGTIPEIKDNIIYGHPKFDHLKKEITEHFNNARYRGQQTKAIVFCEYRESVNLVHCLLLQCRPLLKPQIFIGQGPGSGTGKDAKAFSQKQQLRVMQMFREGTCNVLVSTCVGEEGLDIGNVDLIICFDISNKSPVRLVQRCGRTGRERSGRVVILVTEGKEHQTLKDCMYERDNLNKKILQSKQLQESLFKNSPRMVPLDLNPECQKMFITVTKKVEDKPKSKKVQSKLKNLLTKSSKSFSSDSESAFISKNDYMSSHKNNNLTNFISDSIELWSKSKDFVKNNVDFESDKSKLLSKWTEYQRWLQYTSKIGHSVDSEIYTKVLQFADAKRFNTDAASTLNSDVALTQTNQKIITMEMIPKKSHLKKQSKPPKKINDIRKMFRNVAKANNDEGAIFSYQLEEFLNKFGIDTSSTQSISDILKIEKIPSNLLNLIVELEIEKSKKKKSMDSIISNTKLGKKDSTLPSAVLIDYSFPQIPSFNGIGSVSFDLLQNSTNLNDCNIIDAFTELEEFRPCPDIIDEFNDAAYDSEVFDNISPKCDNNKTITYENQKNFDLIDMEAIFEDSISSQNKSKSEVIKKGLDFFRLEDIDDLFSTDTPNEDNDSNHSIENVISPIISSQIPKKSIFHKTTDKLAKSFKELSQKADDSSNFFTISQAINFISSNNKLSDGTSKGETESTLMSFSHNSKNMHREECNHSDDLMSFSYNSKNMHREECNHSDLTSFSFNTENMHREESNGSDSSVILCSQVIKRKFYRKKKSPKQFRPNIIIPASSDESDTNDEIDCEKSNTEKVDSNQNINKINSDDFKLKVTSTLEKRELSSEDEISPFFNKIPKIENVTQKNTSLIQKSVNVSNISKLKKLSTSTMKENVSPIDENVSFINISSEHDSSTCSKKNIKIVPEKQSLNLSRFERLKNRSFSHLNESKNEKFDSDDDFVERPRRKPSYKNDKSLEENQKIKVKKKKKICEFIDYEAILSGDDSSEKGCSEDDSGSNTTLGSFIHDENDDADVSIDMQAKYLESIKSPANNGKFKIPKLPDDIVDVLSQENSERDNSYELDSFCVGSQYGLTQVNEQSELEIAESLLKKRKHKKQKRTLHNLSDDNEEPEDNQLKKKRKRIRLQISSDDSD